MSAARFGEYTLRIRGLLAAASSNPASRVGSTM
jgi:hypothetical protein